MKSIVTDLHLSSDEKTAIWKCDNKKICVSYDHPVEVVPFYESAGVVVVEHDGTAPDNAVILDALGGLVKRVENPFRIWQTICFKDVYYEPGDADIYLESGVIKLIAAMRAAPDIGCFLDRDGNIFETREAR